MSFGPISVQKNALWVNKSPSHLPEADKSHIIAEHKPGSVNKATDALSRAPVLTSEGDTSTIEILRVETQAGEPLLTRIRHLQCEDRDLAKLVLYLEKKHLPEESGEVKKIVTQC